MSAPFSARVTVWPSAFTMILPSFSLPLILYTPEPVTVTTQPSAFAPEPLMSTESPFSAMVVAPSRLSSAVVLVISSYRSAVSAVSPPPLSALSALSAQAASATVSAAASAMTITRFTQLLKSLTPIYCIVPIIPRVP